MKRFLSSFFIMIFVFVTAVLPFNTTSVSADNTHVNDDRIVFYQAVVKRKNSNLFSGVTAISQAYFKRAGDIGEEDSDGNLKSAIENIADFTTLNTTSICNISNINNASLCDKGELNAALATIRMDSDGNIEVVVANEVAITNLRIFYVIANKSNEVQLFCGSNKICERAKRISVNDQNNSNWKNMGKNNSYMSYDSNMLGFTSSERAASTAYHSYNVVENMSNEYRELAKKFGAYVTMAMSIRYKNENYYLNQYMLDYNSFSDVGNTYNGKAQNLMRCDFFERNNTDYNCQNGQQVISYVSSAAALVRPLSSTDVDSNSGYTEVHKFFKDIGVPVLKIIIIIMFLITGTSTMINIVKSSDEPEVRSAEIKRFVWLFLGALLIFLILQFYEPLIKVVSGWLG